MQKHRVCVCIGCDQYDNHPAPNNLTGCVNDADNLFNILINPEVGQYSASNSILLKNPSSDEVRLMFLNFSISTDIDTLTIYFAGHGGTKDGSYFLTTRDTVLGKLSLTSLPFTDLLMFVKEMKPRQVNFIIDACEGGGIANDLGTILRGDVVGAYATMGISLFVSSASNRNAEEAIDGSGGVITNLLCDVIRGRIPNRSGRPYLTLVEVGDLIWETGSAVLKQQPSTWAINIFGETALCKNPTGFDSIRARSDYVIKGYDVSDLAGLAEQPTILEPVSRLFLELPGSFDAEDYRNLFGQLCSAVENEHALIEVARGLGTSLRDRCSGSLDPFLRSKISATVIANLLPAIRNPDRYKKQLLEIVSWFNDDLNRAIELVSEATDYKYWLLSNTGGGAMDLYFIPIKASKILGYLGASKLIEQELGKPRSFTDSEIRIIESISKTYTLNLKCVNELQTPFLLLFFVSYDGEKDKSPYEIIRGAFYNDLYESHGFVSEYEMPAQNVVEYLLMENKDHPKNFQYEARPCTLLTLLIFEFIRSGDAEIIRYDLTRFDHKSLNWFIPKNQMHFSLESIEEGENFNAEIGHSFFTTAEIEKYWQQIIVPFIDSAKSIDSDLGAIEGIAASLVYNDRAPWFLARRK